ncbi:MAG: U32 family peptidase [Clostridiales bacterium]|nr:U32 family peptidase [Clostridiales bacterium]
MENLAPAGTPEALERAVAAGADAVYLGCSAFSARAGAGNFDEEQLRRAVSFAHLHHVRVHVTVNTLIKDAEMDEVKELLRLLNEVRVDAVLVQDLGVLRMARECFPDLPIHASTQMAIHNATGAGWCARMGMTRAVLARECSLSEIALAAKQPIEIEVFGHGAQCVGVSGQCLFSSMIGSRSGNRGRCAQPCRLDYTYRGKRSAWLSPRDVCLRDYLPELKKAGACSIKIEGRLKRPEYVAVVAGSYRRGLDGKPADAAEKQGLLQIFQRGGFMKGYAMGAEDAVVIDPTRVNHGGVAIGSIEAVSGRLARVRLTLDLHDGDGLQIRHGHEDHEMIYAGRDALAGDVAVLRLRPDMRVQPGDTVVRLTSARQLEEARSLTIPEIPCDMTLVALPGEPLTLTVTDGVSIATATGDAVSAAQKRAMSEEDARRSLEKTGDTPFALRELTVYTDNAFVPVSALNALRRDALDRLAAQRTDDFARSGGAEQPEAEARLPVGPVPPMTVCRTPEQLKQVTDGIACWYPEDFREAALAAALPRLPQGTWLHLPMACEEATLLMLHRLVTEYADRLGGVVLGSVGQLGLKWPVPYGAGSGVPVMNRRSAVLLFEQGCAFVTASPELSGAETAVLMAGKPPILVPAYGYAQLMLLHHCPARTYLGLDKGHAACGLCDVNDANALRDTALTDRKGVSFPLLRQRLPEGCLVRLMNALPTDNLARVKAAGYSPLIELTLEGGCEATSGHWNRPVE